MESHQKGNELYGFHLYNISELTKRIEMRTGERKLSGMISKGRYKRAEGWV